MAKLRLLAGMKETLRANVRQHVVPRNLKAALDTAYALCLPAVKAAADKKWPSADLKVLRKYELTTKMSRVQCTNKLGQVKTFHVAESDEIELPDKSWYSERQRVPMITDKETAVLDQWLDAHEAYNIEFDKRVKAYDALIHGANYLEDLLEIWPEAAALVPRTGGAILALGPDQIAVIRRDLAEQRAR